MIFDEMRVYKKSRNGKKDLVCFQAFIEVKNSIGPLWPVL